jgi:hypothetical protein
MILAGDHWLDVLDDEDLAFLKRFLLASGSLKQVAKDYGISYPTIRIRLDRLIAKVEVADRHRDVSAYERILRSKYVDGKLDLGTLKELLDAYRNEKEEQS